VDQEGADRAMTGLELMGRGPDPTDTVP